ncbi:MAG: peptide chain release factor 2 [Proteiniphilum sp.]|nr:peptide chain release factor 2 [Proteiniphilum sp.]
MITADQLTDVLEREHALRGYLDVDAKIIQLEEEELRTQSPDFWNDAKAAEAQMKVVRELKFWINAYHNVKAAADELQLAFDFVKEGILSEEEVEEQYAAAIRLVEDLELKNMLRREEDKLGAVLKINAGAGGTESQDWASMLFRMYQRWCESKNYQTTVTNWQDGDDAGIKTATLQVEGELAYGFLKSENGVHRLVRVSPYNAQGKRMTSFASVFVVPLVDDTIEIEVNPANLSWDTFRSSGAGGQNVNKVETGVRLHYLYKDPDTGEAQEIVIENTESRSQMDNRENAMRLLKSQLYEMELEKRRAAQAAIEAGKKKIEWGSQIRSYVFDDRRVKDHRTNFQTSDVNGVMDGDLDDFIKAYLMEYGSDA